MTQIYQGLISDMPEEQRPREKAMSCGIKALSNEELMAIIFATGIKGKGVVQMCREILDDNRGHISKVAAMDVREFTSRYKGIGPAKALTMLAALELGFRSAADALLVRDPEIRDASSAYEYMRQYLENLPHEEFWILLLKQNMKVKKTVQIGRGGLTSTAVDVKIIIREALLANTPHIMLFHNHPSGNLNPSIQDKALTDKIAGAAKMMDLRVPDHIIIGGGSYYSFHDNGLL